MQRRTFFRLTAAGAVAPLLPLAACDSDGAVRFPPFEAAIRAREDGLVFFDAIGRSYLVSVDAERVTSADAVGADLGELAANVSLRSPVAVCATNDGTRFVLERGGARLIRLGPDGVADALFGGAGSESGRFLMPSDLDASDDGLLFVADTLNHRIQVLDPEGNVVDSFGTAGTGEFELNGPRGVACGRRHVFVANTGNGQVLALGYDGEPEFAFEVPHARFDPTGVATRGTEEVLVIDTNACALVVYDARGRLVERRDVREPDGRRAHPVSVTVDPTTGDVLLGVLPGAPA